MADGHNRVHSVVLVILSLATAGLIAWVLWTGSDYYTTPLVERPHHEDFRAMRPAGRVGHGLGILGSVMLVALLIYSLRKRVRFMQRWGDLRVWLRYHIFLGVVGPILITLHTSFKVDGLVAVSYWSMFAVALSGVFGRYLYQQIPRNVLGETLSSDDIESRNESILVELSENHAMGDQGMAALEKLADWALKKVVITDRVGSGPFDPEIFAAVGRDLDPGPDYIITVNMLYSMGINATVDYIPAEYSDSYASREEAMESCLWMIDEINEEERVAFDQFIESRLTQLDDGSWEVTRNYTPKWAVISWSKH